MLKKTGLLVLEFLGFAALAAGIFFLLSAFISIAGIDLGEYYDKNAVFQYPFATLLIQYIPLLVSVLIAMVVLYKVILKRKIIAFGLTRSGVFKDTGRGGLLALSILLTGFLLLYIFNGLEIQGIDWNLKMIAGFALLFIVQSGVEELIGRSFLIPLVEHRFNTMIAIMVSSLIFSFAHLGNANVSILATVNIFLAGVLMGILFVRTRKIWAPLGFHACWNYVQGSVLGFGVSGIEVYSILDTVETGNDWLTGGIFGFEASVLCGIGLLTACIWLWFWKPADPGSKTPA